MNPPSVFLDHSFLVALQQPADEHHDEATVRYRELIDEFLAQRCLLVGRADHLTSVGNRELFAPIDKLHVARQHRNAATELVARTGLAIDEAITLVMLHRYRIRRVASYSTRLADYDLDMKVPLPANFVADDTPGGLRTATLAPEAG